MPLIKLVFGVFLFSMCLDNLKVVQSESRPASSRPSATTSSAEDKHWHLHEGLVAALVPMSLEEQAWVVTRGRTKQPTRDELAAWERLATPENIDVLKQVGVNMVVIPYGGYEPDAQETAGRDRAVAFATLCREAGMHVGVIVPVGSADPRRWEGVLADPQGLLTRSVSGGAFAADSLGRFMTRRLDAWEAERTARLVEEAVSRTQADAFFLPDFQMAVNHDPEAATGFQNAVRDFKKRHGGRLTGELKLDEMPPGADASGVSALIWRDYRSRSLSGVLDSSAKIAWRVRPGTLRGVMGTQLDRQVAALDGFAVDPAVLLPAADLIWFDGWAGIGPDGRVRHFAYEFKAAGGAAAAVVPTVASKTDVGQSLVFNRGIVGCIAHLTQGHLSGSPHMPQPVVPDIVELARFAQSNRDLFNGHRAASDIAFFQSGIEQDDASSVLTRQASQALVTNHIPFEVIHSLHALKQTQGTDQAALMLAGCRRMSDGDVTAVLDFVRGGGGLVSIGPYGTEDELGQSRTVGLIEQLQPLARVTKAGSEASSPPTSQPQESRGRVVSLQTAGRVSEIWMRTQSGIKAGPVSASVALPEAVESSLGRPLSVAGIPLGPVGIEWTVSDDGNRYVLHRVNFDPRMPAAPTKVTLRVAPRRKVSKVACYRAGTSPENIAFRAAGNAVTFKSAELDVYDAYLIHTESSAPSDHP